MMTVLVFAGWGIYVLAVSSADLPHDASTEELHRIYRSLSGAAAIPVLLRLAKYPGRLPPDIREEVEQAMDDLIASKGGTSRRQAELRAREQEAEHELRVREQEVEREQLLAEHERAATQLGSGREAVALARAHRPRDPEVALVYAVRATQITPENAGAWACLASCQRKARQTEGALASAGISVSLEPELSRNPAGYTTLLAALVDADTPDAALAGRLEDRADDGFAQNAAGRALKVLGELERAEACFMLAIALGQTERDSTRQLEDIVTEYRKRGDEPNATRLEGYLIQLWRLE